MYISNWFISVFPVECRSYTMTGASPPPRFVTLPDLPLTRPIWRPDLPGFELSRVYKLSLVSEGPALRQNIMLLSWPHAYGVKSYFYHLKCSLISGHMTLLHMVFIVLTNCFFIFLDKNQKLWKARDWGIWSTRMFHSATSAPADSDKSFTRILTSSDVFNRTKCKWYTRTLIHVDFVTASTEIISNSSENMN